MGKILSCVEGRAPKGRSPPRSPFESDPAPEPTPTSGDCVYGQPCQEPVSYVNAGYWASWQAYEGIFPSNLDVSAITHIFYAFADIDGDGSIFLKDEYLHYEIGIDGTNGCLRACTQLKDRNPHLKVILSVGGGGEDVAGHFVDVAGHPSKLQRFSNSAKNLVDMFQLDGVDTDWESPATKQQGLQYLEMIKSLRESLPRAKNHLLSVTLAPDLNMLRHIPLSEISKLVDSLNLMAYDFVGPKYHGVEQTGHHAQLFNVDGSQSVSGASAVDWLLVHDVPAEKIILGVPVYCHSFRGADGPNQKFLRPGKHDEAQFRNIPRGQAEEVYDSNAVAVSLRDGDDFLTYDNKLSIAEKARYAKRNGLGGLFYWHLGADSFDDESLIKAGYETLKSVDK